MPRQCVVHDGDVTACAHLPWMTEQHPFMFERPDNALVPRPRFVTEIAPDGFYFEAPGFLVPKRATDLVNRGPNVRCVVSARERRKLCDPRGSLFQVTVGRAAVSDLGMASTPTTRSRVGLVTWQNSRRVSG